ncbi:hypothetical protein ACQQ2Q_16825 [Agrobacterium sp. ES01]|uniref:hypothetical protein n=1 Tax=Agrobacterium sp. ES01 TaxID=3420714 RepID=UPI003D0F28E9
MGASRFNQQHLWPDVDVIPPDRKARAKSRLETQHAAEVVDAEFITIVEAPRRSFDARRFNDNRRQETSSVGDAQISKASLARHVVEGLEDVLGRLSNNTFAMLVACAFFAVFMLVGGLSASAYSGVNRPTARALDITHVSVTPQDANGMRVLLINAIIENHSNLEMAPSPVRADLISGGQLVASTLIHLPVRIVQPGQSRGFAAKIQYAGGKIPELKLSFAPRDVQHP